ncbi:MAG TPA: SUF system NifU family Fe-S cluster assembly protein [Thermoplasmata archaeon]|nr:SUF system NifU family Fe-S cluster assembly protein [Thermoplasmata archaeon]
MASGPGPYQAQILDHYKHPHNRGVLNAATHQARESNPLCGDEILMTLRVDESDQIAEVRFDGEGCAISMASASLLTDEIKGKTLGGALAIGRDAALKALGVPLSSVREQCALLPLRALQAALAPRVPAQGH